MAHDAVPQNHPNHPRRRISRNGQRLSGCDEDALQADREGRRLELAEKFEGSLTYLDGQMLVDAEMMNTKGANSEMLKELKTKRATSTSFFFALKTILKVRHPFPVQLAP